MVTQVDPPSGTSEFTAATTAPIAEDKNPRRAPAGLTFRLEYFPEQVGRIGSIRDDPRPAPLTNWERVFEVSDKTTLEQFAAIILNLLGWQEDHLYEFHIYGNVYVHMGDPDYSDYFVDAVNPCVSCAIRLHYLKLTPGTEFDFIFDFGECHLFRLTLSGTSPHQDGRPLPSLISYRGKNLQQYAGPISSRQRRLIQEKVPTIKPPRPSGDTSSIIRFVRREDHATLIKWRASNDKTSWEKAVTVLENRSLSVEKISEKIERSVNVIQHWIMAFNHRGILGLDPPRKQRSPGELEAAAEQRKKRLLDILHDRPRSFGISRASWSLISLAKAYTDKYGEPVSRSSVSRAIHKAGYSIKKARRVLTSPDPEYREKVEQVLNTLQNLKPDERFFFIDELGPLRVKKYGGRTFAAKGDTPTFPQVQAHKGSITMAAALSATANQVTWLFSLAKDTQSMIDLIEILFNQHSSMARLFLTWDAASWHSSIALVEWLDAFNAETGVAGFGPTIRLVPLPTSSRLYVTMLATSGNSPAICSMCASPRGREVFSQIPSFLSVSVVLLGESISNSSPAAAKTAAFRASAFALVALPTAFIRPMSIRTPSRSRSTNSASTHGFQDIEKLSGDATEILKPSAMQQRRGGCTRRSVNANPHTARCRRRRRVLTRRWLPVLFSTTLSRRSLQTLRLRSIFSWRRAAMMCCVRIYGPARQREDSSRDFRCREIPSSATLCS